MLADAVAAAAARAAGSPRPSPRPAGWSSAWSRRSRCPTFEEVRAQLAEQAAADADKAGTALVADVRDDLDVDRQPALRRPGQRARSWPARAASVTAARATTPRRRRPARPGALPETDRVPVALARHRQPPPARPAGPGRLAGGHRRPPAASPCPAPRPPPRRCAPRGSTVTDVPDAGGGRGAGRRRRPAGRARRRPVAPAAPVDGAPEPAGARLLDVVAVMDRLRSPGRLPLGRRADARLAARLPARGGARGLRRDRRRRPGGDARGARRRPAAGGLPRPGGRGGRRRTARFDVDDVAGDLVDKLVRRHPHVFGDAGPRDVAAVEAGWEEIKQAEKQRRSPTEGVSRSQPAAAWGAALVRRAGRAGLPTPAGRPSSPPTAPRSWGSGCSPSSRPPSSAAGTSRTRCARPSAATPASWTPPAADARVRGRQLAAGLHRGSDPAAGGSQNSTPPDSTVATQRSRSGPLPST